MTGDVPAPDACHCRACRKSSGHFFVSTDVPRDRLVVRGSEHVRWYASSRAVRRGFCGTCGSPLFWDRPARDWIGVATGAFDDPIGTRIAAHVHVGEKGDYYALPADEPAWLAVPPPHPCTDR
ncbi:GFA family protein [Sphingomonas sp.]|uniref:GFA family protein n=1 Tax=Sphingomonas sp. TaxID=28214 RepID=UPI0025F99245|nr:GFA family protein [Sphingomonas sp.]